MRPGSGFQHFIHRSLFWDLEGNGLRVQGQSKICLETRSKVELQQRIECLLKCRRGNQVDLQSYLSLLLLLLLPDLLINLCYN